MIRILLNYLIPFLLPLLLYFFWVLVLRRRFKGLSGSKMGVTSAGIFSSVLVGLVLMAITIVVIAFSGGAPPGQGKYESPRLQEGKIIPPKMY